MSQPLVSGVHIRLVGERLHVGSVHKTGWGHNCSFGVQCVCTSCITAFFYICLYKMHPLLAWHMKQWTSVQESPCVHVQWSSCSLCSYCRSYSTCMLKFVCGAHNFPLRKQWAQVRSDVKRFVSKTACFILNILAYCIDKLPLCISLRY